MMKKFLTFVFSQVKRNKLSVSPGGKNKRAKRYSLFFQSVEKRFTWGFASFSSLFSEFSQFSTISFNLFQKFSQIWKKLVEKFFFRNFKERKNVEKRIFTVGNTKNHDQGASENLVISICCGKPLLLFDMLSRMYSCVFSFS